ncbi:probable Subtilisin-like proteinase Spm1 [Cephalotrichum gorgonifer]|uniref:Probable Subtilisin-like proteinase Spm1 n=1 Tax=Cephalotrichum gorgonifer TaxID=2041049 RepID=A0AAE8MU08_9PEZI|nr:probable Subtilisin-like proteinase Spm1 [Cephalotrichum gorgonifer]
MKGAVVFFLAAVATASQSAGVETIHDGAAPVLSSTSAETIPGHYIIKFKKGIAEAAVTNHHTWIQQIHEDGEVRRTELRKRGLEVSDGVFSGIKHTYNLAGGFLGYSGHFDEDVIEQVRRHPDVEFIEKDSMVHTQVPLPGSAMEGCDSDVEKNAPWGLARISHRDTLTFGTFNKYLYAAEGGEGVDAYVIDTGTNINHVDFEGRAKWGQTIPAGDEDEDGNGHGTHCSGTVAGKKYGVAKKANVYAVKVLRSNGSGTMSDVVKGVEWAANSHLEQVEAAKKGKRKGFKGSVANMSLGGGKTVALDRVVDAAVDAGVHFAVAAGNDNADACNYSPAAAAKAVTVGASALDDSRAYFSNWGKCTDIFAPGLSILSTWIGSPYAVNTISGTSMASPHIAGLLAYLLSLQPAIGSEFYTPLTPEKLKANLLKIATVGTLTDLPADTPNLLAWNGGGCSDYSSIIEKGGYEVSRTTEKTLMETFEKTVEEDYEIISEHVSKGAQGLSDAAEQLADKINHLVEEELAKFVQALEA